MYDYAKQRAVVFTDDGQRMFLKIRDHTLAVLQKSGAITLEKAMNGAGTGDSWDMIACVDRMVELGELVEVPISKPVPAQHRIFMKANP